MDVNFEELKQITLTDDDMFIVQDKETGWKQRLTKSELAAALGGGGGGGGEEYLTVGSMRVVEDVAGAFQHNLFFDVTAPTTAYDPDSDDLCIEIDLQFGVNANALTDGPQIIHWAALTDFAANSIAEDNLYNTENWASRVLGTFKAKQVGTAPVLINNRQSDNHTVFYPNNNNTDISEVHISLKGLRPVVNNGDNMFVGKIFIASNSTGAAVHFGTDLTGTCWLEAGTGVAGTHIIPDKIGLMLYDENEPASPSTLVPLTGTARMCILRNAR
jgi:hypothetical protein